MSTFQPIQFFLQEEVAFTSNCF